MNLFAAIWLQKKTLKQFKRPKGVYVGYNLRRKKLLCPAEEKKREKSLHRGGISKRLI